MNFINIAKAWIISFNPTDEQLEKANSRISICNKCPNIKHISHINEYVCGICNCPLSKKIFSPTPDCPENFWNK